MNHSKSKYLELEVIWNDTEFFEYRVFVTNGRYSGTTEVYEQKRPLLEFCDKLESINKKGDNACLSSGKKDEYAYFNLYIHKVGHMLITAHMYLEENVETNFRPEEKDKLKIELIIEKDELEIFTNQLRKIATSEKGKARLNGK